MEVKAGYKQTEVGVIPEEWEAAALGTIASFSSGSGISIAALRDQSTDFPVPVFGGNGIAGYTKAPLVRERTVVIGRVGQKCGEVHITNGPAWISDNALFPKRTHRDYDLTFFGLALQAAGLNDVKNRNDLPLLTQAILHAKKIAWPPATVEQRAIAEALGDMDGLLGGLERLITKKRDLKQAAMQQLLTGKVRLPGFRGEWVVKRLAQMAELNRLNVIPANTPSAAFTHFSLPAFDAGKIASVETGAAIGSNKFRVLPEAVLVSKLNPRIPRIWTPDYIPANAIASTEWLVLTPKEGTERKFLHILCSSPTFCEQMELGATGTTGSHQRISPTRALGIATVVPAEQAEQTAIAAVLSDMDAEIAALEQRREKTRALKQAMMQELLTGRTRLA